MVGYSRSGQLVTGAIVNGGPDVQDVAGGLAIDPVSRRLYVTATVSRQLDRSFLLLAFWLR